MSSGSYYRGNQNIYNNTVDTVEYVEKSWNGGDDPTKHHDQNYTMNFVWWRKIATRQKNPYYPFVPEYYLSGSPYSINKVTLFGKPANSNTELRALGKAIDQMKGHDFDATSALADAEKTLEMLMGAVKSCFDLLRALQRFDLNEALRLLACVVKGSKKELKRLRDAFRSRDIADIWLAAQYGWKPLVADVDSFLNAWKDSTQKPRSLKWTARAASPDVNWDCRVDSQAPIPMKCQERIRYAITVEEILSPYKYYGLDNWATVIWERIPFSFVVDWFIPIGQAIQEFGFFRGLSYKVTESVYQRFSLDIPTYAFPLDDHLTGQKGWLPGRLTARAVVLRRTVSDRIGLKLPSLKSFEKAFSTEHSRNAAALLYSWADDFRNNRGSFRPF